MGRERLRSDVLRFASVLAVACSGGLGLRLLAGPVPDSTVALALGFAVFFLVIAVTADRILPLSAGAIAVVFGLQALVLAVPLLSDGFATPILFILPVTPTLAARLLGRRGPVSALVVALLGIAALLAVHGESRTFYAAGDHSPTARAILLVIAVLLGAVFAHASERRRWAGKRRLGATEARYRMLFARSQDPVIMTTPDGRIVDLNEAAMTSLGFTDPQEAFDTSVSDLYVQPEAREELLNELRDSGTIKQRFSRLRRRDGREMTIAGSTVAERGSDGEVETLLTIFRDVTREHQREASLLEQTRRDPLTGLANRRAFEERLGEAMERSARYLEASAVLLLDLDDFKQVNDEHGHPVGDAVLKVVSERLAGIVRRVDTVGRLGGDEFAVINTRATPEGVHKLAQRLIAALEVPIHVEGSDFCTSTCVGATFCAPGASHDTVVARADRALYQAKHRGRGQIQIEPAEPADSESEGDERDGEPRGE